MFRCVCAPSWVVHVSSPTCAPYGSVSCCSRRRLIDLHLAGLRRAALALLAEQLQESDESDADDVDADAAGEARGAPRQRQQQGAARLPMRGAEQGADVALDRPRRWRVLFGSAGWPLLQQRVR
jgi:hypothetical protein